MALVSVEDKSGGPVRIIIETLKFLHLSLCVSHTHTHTYTNMHAHAQSLQEITLKGYNFPLQQILSWAPRRGRGGIGIIYAYMHEYPASVRGSMLKGKIKKIIRSSNSYVLCWSPQPK